VAGLVDFSESALGAFKRQLEQRPARAIRLGVKGGSCSGLRYVIEFEDAPPRAGDNEWVVDGMAFVVDKKSALYLSGSTVTWSQTMMKQGFDFVNPHEASRCGCGASFNTK
jgi:iron-sulfur cluster assembly protein